MIILGIVLLVIGAIANIGILCGRPHYY